MAALDTNVLVRYLVRDDADQFAAAQRLIQQCVHEQWSIFVPLTVTLELEWVLRARYGFTKQVTLGVLSDLFSAAELSFESEHALELALHLYRNEAADFADCVHLALATQAGELPLWTFDKTAARISGAKLLSS